MQKNFMEDSEVDVSEVSSLLSRRKNIESKIDRLKGRFEEAKRNLEQLEQECVDLGFSGSVDLDKAISTLEERIKQTYTTLKVEMGELEVKLSTYEV